MGFLQDIPVEIMWVALVMGIIYAMFRWCMASAQEEEEPSADQELKK